MGVLRSCLKPRYLLKFRKLCPLNGGPLSLPQTEVFQAMRISGQALVLLRGSYKLYFNPRWVFAYDNEKVLTFADRSPEVYGHFLPGFNGQ